MLVQLIHLVLCQPIGHYTAANTAVGQVNLADSTSNEWYITGVQLEAGTAASDFEFLPHDVNLQRCYRYYRTLVPLNSFDLGWSMGFYTASNKLHQILHLENPMRAILKLEIVTGTDYFRLFTAAGNDLLNSASLPDTGENLFS